MYLIRWFLPLAAGLSQLAHSQETALRSGNYILRYCGNDTASKGWQLGSLLLRFRSDLQLVLTDVRRGTASKAYRAFFKSQKNAAFVQDIFRKIAIGNSIQVSVNGVVHTYAPTIVCPDPAIPLYDELIRNCGTEMAAAHLTGRELVYLCPRFWDLDERPVQALCPRVRWNKFTSNHHSMVANMFGAFVHEFAHVYLQDLEAPDETYGLMDAVELSAKASLRNANNYALYAAMVVAGCRKYPNPTLFPAEERLLQEISQGVTSGVAALSSSIAAAEASGSIDSPPNNSTYATLPPVAVPTGNDGVLPRTLAALTPRETGRTRS